MFETKLAQPLIQISGFTLATLRVSPAGPFYRTASGAEIDILAVRGKRKIGFEIKFPAHPHQPKDSG